MANLGIFIGGGIAGAGLLLVLVAVLVACIRERHDPAITPVEHVEHPKKFNGDFTGKPEQTAASRNQNTDEWTVDMAGHSHTRDYALSVEQSARSKVAWS
jgi:hypothetical protein